MMIDRFGMAIATACPVAVHAFERATLAVAAHQPGVPVALGQALAADPGFAAGHALWGFANVMLARTETMAAARLNLSDARRAIQENGGERGEIALVEALALAAQGGLAAAADRLEAHLSTQPGEFLPAKLAHSLRFMIGDAMGMLTSVDRTLVALPIGHPGHGFILGCRAFALEELGAYDAAERLGRRAVDIEPEDSWAIHAVGHVHEMTGRTADGLDWIEQRRPTWIRCNNFALHISWHTALLHLEMGRVNRALEIFDEEVWPRTSDDFRDMSNAVALLARIEQFGMDVGGRWSGPAAIAAARAADTTLTFAALNNLVALVASGHHDKARELAAALDAPGEANDDQERVRWLVGRPLARAILDMSSREARPVDFVRLMRDLPRVGGSNAQRDLFTRLLASMAADRRDLGALEAVLEARGRLKREDRFAALVRERAAAARPRLLTA